MSLHQPPSTINGSASKTTILVFCLALALSGSTCMKDCSDTSTAPSAPIQMTAPVASPDGARVAFMAGHDYQDEEVYVWEPKTDKLTNLTRSFGRQKSYARIVWSPDSRYVAIPMCGLPCSEHSLSLFDVQTGDRRELAAAPNIPELAFSADGKQLAYVTDHGSGELFVVSTVDGKPKKLTPSRQSAIQSLVFASLRGRAGVFYVSGWLWGERNLYFAPLSGDGPEQLSTDGGYARVVLDAQNQRVDVLRAGSNGAPPARVYAVDLQTGKLRDTEATGASLEGRIPVLTMGGRASIDHGGRSLPSARVSDVHHGERAARSRQEAREKENQPWFPPNVGRKLELSDADGARTGVPLDVSLKVNNSDGKYTSFNMRVELPDGFTVVSGQAKWSGPLAKGESHTLRLQVRVPDEGRHFINAYGSWSGSGSGSTWSGREWVFTEVDVGDAQPRRYRTYPTLEGRSGASRLEVVETRRIHRNNVTENLRLGPHSLRILRMGAGPHLSGTRKPESVGVRVEAHLDDEKVLTFGCSEEKDYGFQLRPAVLREETNPVTGGQHPRVEAGFQQDSVAVTSFSYDPDSYAWEWMDIAMLRYRESVSPITYKSIDPVFDDPEPQIDPDLRDPSIRASKGKPVVVEGTVTATGDKDIVLSGLCRMITFEHSLSAVVKGGGDTFVWALSAVDTENKHPHHSVTIKPGTSHAFRIDLARALRKSDGVPLNQVPGTYTAFVSHQLGDIATLAPATVRVVIE